MSPENVQRRRRIFGVLLALGVLVAAATAGSLLASHGRSGAPVTSPATVTAGTARASAEANATADSLPAPATGFAVPRAHQLDASRDQTRWAPVLRSTWARQAPDRSSPPVARVSTRSPEGTTNLVDADGEIARHGEEWIRARLAVLPNGTTGWIPRTALGGWSFVETRVVVDRRALTLTLYRAGRAIFRTAVGVGKPGTPTPAGDFYVRDRLTRYASPEYGPVAFGTTARSAVETDWPAGGFIGIHGTDQPGLIPGRISHGCVRLRNSAILTLARLMPVGTPIVIR